MKQLHELSGALLEYWYCKAENRNVRLVKYDEDLVVYEKFDGEPEEYDVHILGFSQLIDKIIDKYEISLHKTQFDWAVPHMDHGYFTGCIAYGETREVAALRYVIFHKLGVKEFEEVEIAAELDSPAEQLRKLAGWSRHDSEWMERFEIESFDDEESGQPVYCIKPEGGSVEDMVAQVFDDENYAKMLAILTPHFIRHTMTELIELRKFKENHKV